MFIILELDFALLLGVTAFVLHLFAYFVYAYHIFHERTRPNAASWFMWTIGGVIEYLTYDAIGESHWSTSALPLACVIGLTVLCVTTIFLQLRARLRPALYNTVQYHAPEKSDYALTGFDLGAGYIWIWFKTAGIANFIAVSTSIISFIPIWKTTYKHNDEHPMPWLLWCIAYILMIIAVLMEGGGELFYKLFYPVYYLLLHLVMLLLTASLTRTLFISCIRRFR